MNFDKKVADILEAVYVPKTSSVSLRGSALEDEEVKVTASAKILEHFKKLKQLIKKSPDSPEVRQFTLDTFNLIQGFNRDYFVFGKEETSKFDILENLLKITSTPRHNYLEMANFTIDELKERGFDMGFYHVYEKVLRTMYPDKDVFDTHVKGRSRREDLPKDGSSEDLYYFGKDGNPYYTFVLIGRSGRADKGVFWSKNRYKRVIPDPKDPTRKVLQPQTVGEDQKPKYIWNGEPQTPRFNPKNLRGATLQEIRDAVDHNKAKAAFEKKYPRPKYNAMYRSGPMGKYKYV